jgi:DNA-binding CsgD family transcriptional regulator
MPIPGSLSHSSLPSSSTVVQRLPKQERSQRSEGAPRTPGSASSSLLVRDEVRDLRSHVFELDGQQYAVLSFESAQPPRLAGLSNAETEVVRAALAGLTNEEIAVTRGRSIFTIQNQLAAAWRKLGVSSRHEAAALLAGVDEP